MAEKLLDNTENLLEAKALNSCISLYNNMRREPKSILHYPQLNTVLMVEKFIWKHSGEYKRRSLWEHLPKKVMYQTFCVIIDYLLYSGKIAIDRKGTIGWIWNPKLVDEYLKKPHLRAK